MNMKESLKSVLHCALPFRFSLAACVLAFLVGSAARISTNRLNSALDNSTEALGQPAYVLKAHSPDLVVQ